MDQTVEDAQTAHLIGAKARHDGEFVAVTLFSWGSEMTIQLKPSQATALVYELTRAANLATYERWDRLGIGTEYGDVR